MPDPVAPIVPPASRQVEAFARAYHGFEVRGAGHIPTEGSALLVFYHGFMPLDVWYFGAWTYRHTGRLVRGLGDDWMFKTPGLSTLLGWAGSVPARPEAGRRLLDDGHLVIVSPGGVREAISGRPRHYQLVWGRRLGFARLALSAGVDILPAFSENVEEIYRSPLVHLRPFQELYERTRWPLVPIVGLGALPFPVKVRTWIAPPVRHDPTDTPERLRDRTHAALTQLMDERQGPRPRLPRALWQRVRGE